MLATPVIPTAPSSPTPQPQTNLPRLFFAGSSIKSTLNMHSYYTITLIRSMFLNNYIGTVIYLFSFI